MFVEIDAYWKTCTQNAQSVDIYVLKYGYRKLSKPSSETNLNHIPPMNSNNANETVVVIAGDWLVRAVITTCGGPFIAAPYQNLTCSSLFFSKPPRTCSLLSINIYNIPKIEGLTPVAKMESPWTRGLHELSPLIVHYHKAFQRILGHTTIHTNSYKKVSTIFGLLILRLWSKFSNFSLNIDVFLWMLDAWELCRKKKKQKREKFDEKVKRNVSWKVH